MIKLRFLLEIRDRIFNKKSTIKHLTYLSGSSLISSFVGLILIYIFANFLSQNDYGNYKYIYSVGGILAVFSLTAGYKIIVIQSTSKNLDGIFSYLGKRNVLLNLPMLLVGGGMAGYYYLQGNTLLASGILCVSIINIASIYGVLVTAYLNGRKMYRVLFRYQAILSACGATLLGLVVLYTGNLYLLILVNTLFICITSIVSFLYVKHVYLRNNNIDTQTIRYGKHLNFLGINSAFLQNIDSVLIFQLIGSRELALYAVATPIIDRLMGFLNSLYLYALPKFASENSTRVLASLFKRSLILFAGGIVLAGLYMLVAPIIFSILFPKYTEAINLSILFALNLPLVAISILPSAYLDSIAEVRNKYILHSVKLVTRLLSLFVFIQLFGVVGVIYSELLTRFITFLTTVILIKFRSM